MRKFYNKNYIAFLGFLLIIILIFIYGVKINNNKLDQMLDPKFPPTKIQNVGKTIDNKF